MTAIQAIRAYCIGCEDKSEVKNCPVTDCELYPFRMGKNPNYKPRELTPEEKQERAERMRKLNAPKEMLEAAQKWNFAK